MFGKHARMNETGRVVRVVAPDGPLVHILVDRAEVQAFAGDSVLVAVLTAHNALRRHEFGDEPRAGFCLMGACQDCWVWLDHSRVRACTTMVTDGISILSRPPSGFAPRD